MMRVKQAIDQFSDSFKGSENHSCLTHIVLFPIVYLRSSPEVCYQRLQHRGRVEEKPVTLVKLSYFFDKLHHVNNKIAVMYISVRG